MKRNQNLDVIRVVAAFAVVLLHSSGNYVNNNPSISSSDWWIGNLYDSFSRWCVPVFIMLSGALVITNKAVGEPVSFIYKRLNRIFIPIVFWTLFYTLYSSILHGSFNSFSTARSIITGNPYYHMWFLYTLIGLYAFTPFAAALRENCSKRNRIRFIILISITAMVDHYIFSMCKWGSKTFLFSFIPYIGYFMIGAELPQLSINRRVKNVLVIAVCISSILIALLVGFSLPSFGMRGKEFFYDYNNPLVYIQSIGLFILIFNMPKINTKRINKLVEVISPLTFGIYLIHPVLLTYCINFLDPNLNSPAFIIPICALLVFSFSAIISYIISKLAFIRRVIM